MNERQLPPGHQSSQNAGRRDLQLLQQSFMQSQVYNPVFIGRARPPSSGLQTTKNANATKYVSLAQPQIQAPRKKSFNRFQTMSESMIKSFMHTGKPRSGLSSRQAIPKTGTAKIKGSKSKVKNVQQSFNSSGHQNGGFLRQTGAGLKNMQVLSQGPTTNFLLAKQSARVVGADHQPMMYAPGRNYQAYLTGNRGSREQEQNGGPVSIDLPSAQQQAYKTVPSNQKPPNPKDFSEAKDSIDKTNPIRNNVITKGERNSQMTFNGSNAHNFYRNSATNLPVNDSMQEEHQIQQKSHKTSQPNLAGQEQINFASGSLNQSAQDVAARNEDIGPKQIEQELKLIQASLNDYSPGTGFQGRTFDHGTIKEFSSAYTEPQGIVLTPSEYIQFKVWQGQTQAHSGLVAHQSQHQEKLSRALKQMHNLGLEVRGTKKGGHTAQNSFSAHESFSSMPRYSKGAQIQSNKPKRGTNKPSRIAAHKTRNPPQLRGGSVPLIANFTASEAGYTSVSGMTKMQNRSVGPSPISPKRPFDRSIQLPVAMESNQESLNFLHQAVNECSQIQSINIGSEAGINMLSDPHILSNRESEQTARNAKQASRGLNIAGVLSPILVQRPPYNQNQSSSNIVSMRGGGVITQDGEFLANTVLQNFHRKEGQRNDGIMGNEALPSQRLPELDQYELFEHADGSRSRQHRAVNFRLNENSSLNTKSKVSLAYEPGLHGSAPPDVMNYLQSMEQRFHEQIQQVHQRMDAFQAEFLTCLGSLLARSQKTRSRSSSKKRKGQSKRSMRSQMSSTYAPMRQAGLSFNTAGTVDAALRALPGFPASPTDGNSTSMDIRFKTFEMQQQLALLAPSAPISPSEKTAKTLKGDDRVDQYLSQISEVQTRKGRDTRAKSRKKRRTKDWPEQDGKTVGGSSRKHPAWESNRLGLESYHDPKASERMTSSEYLYAKLHRQIEEQKLKLQQLELLKRSKQFQSIETRLEPMQDEGGPILSEEDDEDDDDPLDDSIRAPPSASFHKIHREAEQRGSRPIHEEYFDDQMSEGPVARIGAPEQEYEGPPQSKAEGEARGSRLSISKDAQQAEAQRNSVLAHGDQTLNLTSLSQPEAMVAAAPNGEHVVSEDDQAQDLIKHMQFSGKQKAQGSRERYSRQQREPEAIVQEKQNIRRSSLKDSERKREADLSQEQAQLHSGDSKYHPNNFRIFDAASQGKHRESEARRRDAASYENQNHHLQRPNGRQGGPLDPLDGHASQSSIVRQAKKARQVIDLSQEMRFLPSDERSKRRHNVTNQIADQRPSKSHEDQSRGKHETLQPPKIPAGRPSSIKARQSSADSRRSQKRGIQVALLDLKSEKDELLRKYQEINSKTLLLQHHQQLLAAQGGPQMFELNLDVSFNQQRRMGSSGSIPESQAAAQSRSTVKKSNIPSTEHFPQRDAPERLQLGYNITENSPSRDSYYNKKTSTRENGKTIPSLPSNPEEKSMHLVGLNQSQIQKQQPTRSSIPWQNSILSSPPLKCMDNITQKYGYSKLLDEEDLQPELQLFNESETENNDSAVNGGKHYFSGGPDQSHPFNFSNSFLAHQAHEEKQIKLKPLENGKGYNMDYNEFSVNQVVTPQQQPVRTELFELQFAGYLNQNPNTHVSPTNVSAHVLSPSLLAKKQDDLMRELEAMRLKSLNGSTNHSHPNLANVVSSDKLSYSQTINLNNLRSLENLNAEEANPIARAYYDFDNLEELKMDKSYDRSQEALVAQRFLVPGYEESEAKKKL